MDMNGSADFLDGVVLASVIFAFLLLLLCLGLLSLLLTRSRPEASRADVVAHPAVLPVKERGVQRDASAAALAQAEAKARDALQAKAVAEVAWQKAEQEKTEAVQEAHRSGQWFDAAVAEAGQLVERLNAVADVEVRGYKDVTVPGLLYPGFAGKPLGEYADGAEKVLCDAVRAARANASNSAWAGVRSMAEEVQMYLTRQQMAINEALDRPHDSARTLVTMDKYTTWTLHAVQRLRILAGSWPGVQRADCTFREIVESARGRITGYDRVDYTYVPEVGERWVEGRVVEPITVALTELLANATTCTGDRVTVYVREVPKGFCVVVDDKGAGMNAFQLAEAKRLLSQDTTSDAANLADERKLGFPIIGRLAQDYGFHVDVSAPSPSGGVQASCLIPHSLMSTTPATDPAPVTTAPLRQGTLSAAATAMPPKTSNGLPKRERQRPASTVSARPTQQAITDTCTPEAVAADLGQLTDLLSSNFSSGDLARPTAHDNDTEGHPQS
jgi:hypothetical protein